MKRTCTSTTTETQQRIELALAWMNEHLHDGVTLEEAARVAGFSPFHFHRVFCHCTGETVAGYLRTRRLAQAARRLRQTPQTATQIAYDSGFNTQETFNRAFKRTFGLTPGDYRRRDLVMTKEPRIVEMPDKWLAGIETSTNTTKDRNISKAWKGLQEVCSNTPGLVDNGPAYGLELYEPGAKHRDGTFIYLASIEVAAAAALSHGVTARHVPGGRYAVFTHRGSTEMLGETFGYIYSEWLPASGETLRDAERHSFDFEYYDSRYNEGDPDSELDIYVPLA